MNSRSRSRSPLNNDKSFSGRASPAPSATSTNTNASLRPFKKGRSGQFKLRITNIPSHWNWHDVSTYIKKQTKAVNKEIAEDISFIEMKKSKTSDLKESVALFYSEEKRDQAFDILKKSFFKIEGKKLYVYKNCKGDVFSSLATNKQKYDFSPRMSNDENDKETYGLSVDYLRKLNITPPLTRKVFVRSMPISYKDEAKVRSLFSMAGTVVSIVLLSKPTCINARIEFDHPVEAVQAVSMFNNREVFGKVLKCEIDKIQKPRIEGMPLQGPGLGPNGEPMRGIRVSVELNKLKVEIMNEYQKMQDSINELNSQVTSLIQATNVTRPANTPVQPTPNSLATLSNLLTNQLQPMQLLQNLIQQNTGADLGALSTALQSLTNSNLLQTATQNPNIPVAGNIPNAMNSNMLGGPTMLGTPTMLGGANIPGAMNMPGAPNIPSALNMSGGPNIPGALNMPGGFNIPGGRNMPGGSNMQGGPNMPGGSNMPGGPIMPVGLNMPGGSNMPGGPNMFSDPNNMQRQPFNMPSAANDMQSGFYNGDSNPMANMQIGPQSMPGNQPFNQGQNNVPGYAQSQQGQNMQGGYNNMQNSGLNQQMTSGYAESEYQMGRSEKNENTSTVLLFKNLPISVTQQALQSKMREVGELKYIQMSTPGRALINFYSEHTAEKCIRLFNNSKVDGQTIEVEKI